MSILFLAMMFGATLAVPVVATIPQSAPQDASGLLPFQENGEGDETEEEDEEEVEDEDEEEVEDEDEDEEEVEDEEDEEPKGPKGSKELKIRGSDEDEEEVEDEDEDEEEVEDEDEDEEEVEDEDEDEEEVEDDDEGPKEPKELKIRGLAAGETHNTKGRGRKDFKFSPRVLNLLSEGDWVTVVIHNYPGPDEVGKTFDLGVFDGDVKLGSLTSEPVNIEGSNTVVLHFNRVDLINLIEEAGEYSVRIAGGPGENVDLWEDTFTAFMPPRLKGSDD